MSTNSILSVGDIAKETGRTRQRIWRLARDGEIPAERAPGKQYRFHDSPEFAAWRKRKATAPKASQISRDRWAKIEKMKEILWNRTEVSAEEKKAALAYVECLIALRCARERNQAFPVLEGIIALYGTKRTFEAIGMEFHSLRSFINDLPTSESTP